MVAFLHVLTVIGGIVGALIVLLGVSAAKGAPQEAAAAGIGLAVAVIPYVVMRCAMFAEESKDRAELLAAVRALKTVEPPAIPLASRSTAAPETLSSQHGLPWAELAARHAQPAASDRPSEIGASSPMPRRPPV